jgi:FKBP-type peptidyl-prolyl cis-trans isomerase 2
MIVYQMDSDEGKILHPNLRSLMDDIETTIDANDMFAGTELTFVIKIVEMSEDEFAALPSLDD